MNATLAAPVTFSPPLPAASTQPLWAAVGVLSICVLAMGATLVHVNKRPVPLAQAALPFASALAMNPPASGGMITEEKLMEKPANAGIKSTQSAIKTGVNAGASNASTSAKASSPASTKTPAAPAATSPVIVAQAPSTSPAPSSAPSPEVAAGDPRVISPNAAPAAATQPLAKQVCASCGTVEAVTPMTKQPDGSGVGVIAGGVLGGVVGNQIGKGNGRAATTILGAIGGGWAGNAIEKNMKKTTAYSVRVKMEDGTRRTIEQSSAPMVGSKVTLDGNTMRPS